MKAPRRIHIIGSTGSGKTYLARQLSDQYHIPFHELDNAMWSRSAERPGKNPPEVRDMLLASMINQETWIVEGVYHLWTAQSFHKADKIIFLSPSVYLRDFRIITRFLKQRTGLEKSSYKQTLRGLIKMLKWNHKFERVHKKEIMDCLEPYKDKLIVLKSNKEPFHW